MLSNRMDGSSFSGVYSGADWGPTGHAFLGTMPRTGSCSSSSTSSGGSDLNALEPHGWFLFLGRVLGSGLGSDGSRVPGHDAENRQLQFLLYVLRGVDGSPARIPVCRQPATHEAAGGEAGGEIQEPMRADRLRRERRAVHDLDRRRKRVGRGRGRVGQAALVHRERLLGPAEVTAQRGSAGRERLVLPRCAVTDRKSTRLNSS